jgi:hypothetical protein
MFQLFVVSMLMTAAPREPERDTAQQRFEATQERFDAFMKRRLCTCPATELKKDLKAVVDEMQVLVRSYTEIVEMKDARWAIASLARISRVYGHAGEVIGQMPPPKGLDDPDMQQTFRDEIHKQAQPFEVRAAETLETAENKSKELSVFSPELDAARTEAKARSARAKSP